MTFRTFLLLTAVAITAPACTVYVREPGTVSSDGTVYLGFSLISAKEKVDREEYPVGQQHGAFSAIYLHADQSVSLSQVVVIFADGERFTAPAPATLGGGQSSPVIALPRGPRAIHSILVTGKSQQKGLAKVEIYAKR